MAFRHGKSAYVMVNSKDLSAFCNDLSLTVDADTADTTTFGSTWKTALAGTLGAKLDLKGDYDPTATTGPADVLMGCIIGAVPVAVVHRPGGTGSPQRQNSFNALITSYAESSPVGGIVTFSASLLVTGAITPTNQ